MELQAAQQYKHAPLPGQHWIRLLHVFPKQDDSTDIIVSLTAHELDEDPIPYTSLSYSWGRNSDGDASLSRHVFVDGLVLAVTENLCDFFSRMQREQDETHTRFWIDAVCINQADVKERNAQVAMMAEIYKKAEYSIVWLGYSPNPEGDEAILHAFETMRAFHQQYPGTEKFSLSVCDLLDLFLDPNLSGLALRFGRRVALWLGRRIERAVNAEHDRRSVLRRLPHSLQLDRLAPQLVRSALR